jgi:hypothetical protein
MLAPTEGGGPWIQQYRDVSPREASRLREDVIEPGSADAGGIGHDECTEAQRAGVDHGREPGQVEPGSRHSGRPVQTQREGRSDRERGLQAVERRETDEDADGERQGQAPGWIVEVQGAPEAGHGRRDDSRHAEAAHHARGRPSRMALIVPSEFPDGQEPSAARI